MEAGILRSNFGVISWAFITQHKRYDANIASIPMPLSMLEEKTAEIKISSALG